LKTNSGKGRLWEIANSRSFGEMGSVTDRTLWTEDVDVDFDFDFLVARLENNFNKVATCLWFIVNSEYGFGAILLGLGLMTNWLWWEDESEYDENEEVEVEEEEEHDGEEEEEEDKDGSEEEDNDEEGFLISGEKSWKCRNSGSWKVFSFCLEAEEDEDDDEDVCKEDEGFLIWEEEGSWRGGNSGS